MRTVIGDGHIRNSNDSGMLLIPFGGKFVSVHFVVTSTSLFFWPRSATFLVVTSALDPHHKSCLRAHLPKNDSKRQQIFELFEISESGESSMKAKR